MRSCLESGFNQEGRRKICRDMISFSIERPIRSGNHQTVNPKNPDPCRY